jgi:salicylate hydroxylase
MSLRIAIIGGGLGGLAAALFLREKGIEAMVFEQAQQLGEVGAGIMVPPNMVRPLRSLGLIEPLERFAVRLEAAWEFRRWQSGDVLFSQAMGEVCAQMYGAHCYVAHRADLLGMLATALPQHQVVLGQRCIGVTQDADGARLSFVDRAGRESAFEFDVVIGADGIHSAVRHAVAPEAELRFSGLCAYRCLIPAERAPAFARRPVQTIWLGPGRHLVHYPIRRSELINIVAIVPAGEWRSDSWSAEGRVEDMLAEFADWDPRLRAFLAEATQAKRWALYEHLPLPRWIDGRLAVLGDAAHAMLPFFAQGAAQAIEDGMAIAQCLHDVADNSTASITAALQAYANLRMPRATKVQAMSHGRTRQNHLPDGPEQQARDAEFANGNPLRQHSWIYAHEFERDLQTIASECGAAPG